MKRKIHIDKEQQDQNVFIVRKHFHLLQLQREGGDTMTIKVLNNIYIRILHTKCPTYWSSWK